MGCGAAKDLKPSEPVEKKDSLPGVNENEESSVRRNSQTLNEGADDQLEKDSWVLSEQDKEDDAILVSENAKMSHESILGNFQQPPLPVLGQLLSQCRSIGLAVYSETELERATKEAAGEKASSKKGVMKRPRQTKETKGTFFGAVEKTAKTGSGLAVWDDEYYAEGTWKDDQAVGSYNLCFYGKALPPKLDHESASRRIYIYQGDVKNDKMEGKGLLITYLHRLTQDDRR